VTKVALKEMHWGGTATLYL